jgi:ZIP family zinc transporter
MLSFVLLSMGGSTVFGVLCGLLFRKIPHRLNDIVLGFAAGVMLAAAMFGLMAPAFDGSGGILLPVLGAFAGASLISVLDRFVPHLHRLAGIDSGAAGGASGKTLLFTAAIALHKIPEGLATGVSFSSGDAGSVMTVASSMSLQNVPEAIVIAAPLMMAGVSLGRTIAISFAIASVSMVAVLAGVALSAAFASWSPFLLAAAGGAMLYVISDEMIPETHSHGYEKPATFALIAGLLLVVVMHRLLAGG